VKPLIVLLAASLALFACKQKPEVAATPETLPPGHPPIGAAAAAGKSTGAKVTGTVLDTFDAAGYTYLQLQTASGDQWAAVRQTPVKKGQVVTMDVQMTAEKFESKTLNRTFDRILFGSLEGAASAPAAMPVAAADDTPVKVAKAEGSGAKSVAEVWESRQALKDGHVVVRGKVVKFLGGIMGRNWLHLRDGSGSSDKGDNDLTVTTHDMAAVGDVVTVNGVVHVDKDFGAGYRYPVIIEEANVTK